MVRLHVVHYNVVDGTLADDFANVLKERHEEVHFNGVDKTNFLIVDQIGVVAHAVGKRPEAFEERLVAVVDAHVEDVVDYLFHEIWFKLFPNSGEM